jgi:hypothetical protein
MKLQWRAQVQLDAKSTHQQGHGQLGTAATAASHLDRQTTYSGMQPSRDRMKPLKPQQWVSMHSPTQVVYRATALQPEHIHLKKGTPKRDHM